MRQACICTVYNSCYLTFKSESQCGGPYFLQLPVSEQLLRGMGGLRVLKEEFSGKQWKEKEVDGLKNSLSLALALYLVHDFINVAS